MILSLGHFAFIAHHFAARKAKNVFFFHKQERNTDVQTNDAQ